MNVQKALEAASNLHQHGHSFIEFAPGNSLIPDVIEGWQTFLQLPAEERMKWRVGNSRDWDDGYVYRNGDSRGDAIGGIYDHKDFFHFRPHLFALLEHAGVDYSTQKQWLLNMDKLWHYCSYQFEQIMPQLDGRISGMDFYKRFLSPVARSRHALRLLSYTRPMTPGMELGKSHIDRNFGTFQVYESHPALVLELPEGNINYVPRPCEALAFTSGKAELFTKGILKGVKHSIVVPQDYVPRPGDEKIPRQSIVFFAHIDF